MDEDPTERRPADVLDEHRIAAGLTHGELWLRYFELGGMSTELELEAVLYGALQPSAHDYEVIALALNERFIEMEQGEPVPYGDEEKKIPPVPPEERRDKE